MPNKRIFTKILFLSSLFIFGLASQTSVFAQSATTSVNLVANPSFELQNGGLPQNWSKGFFGKNKAVFTYPVAGYNSAKAAKVELTQYTSGDAKWYFKQIPVTAGQIYSFSDNYLSNIPSSINVAFRMSNGSFKYLSIANLAPATGTIWGQVQKKFTVPANAKSLTIFHLIEKVGWLTVDNYSLSLTGSVLGATAPYITVTSPKKGETVLGNIKLIADTGSSADVAGVQFIIDGTNVGAEVTSAPYQIAFDASVLVNGLHIISATVRDKFGTKASSDMVSVNVAADTVAPTVSVTGLIGGQIISGTINLTAQAKDNVGVVGVQFVVDGDDFGSEIKIPPYQINLNTISLFNGAHIISARARDAAGNKSTSAALSVSVMNINTVGMASGIGGAENLIKNPSLEIADLSENYPLNWSTGDWGANQAVFTYPTTGHNSQKAAKVELTQYTSGDAKWYFDDVPVTPGKTYEFSDYYISSVQTTLTYRFTLSNGSSTYNDLAYLGATDGWQNVIKTFQAPANAVSVTVFHLINSVGSLTVDDFSLTEISVAGILSQGIVSLDFDDGWLTTYQNAIPILNAAGFKSTQYIISGDLGNTADGYVSSGDVLAMQSSGHEIGAHSRTHAHLTQLSDSELQNEISGSRQDLLAIGANPVVSFAYPYGETNSTVMSVAKNAGYTGARGIDFGLNDKNTDSYNLVAKPVDFGTSLDTVKVWVEDAILNKKWLILFFHNIDNSGEQYSTTPANLQAIVDYLKDNNIKVVTNSEGVQILSQP
jgi:peptidoglycan/xylan/chitin deacetylase (PgdA/CDA1 family)